VASTPHAAHTPLAERLRPRTLGEVIGQQHLLGEGMPLRIAFESGQPHSCILWGPPGVGKTTIARLMADAFDAQFITISAVLGGVKDIREAVEQARARAGGARAWAGGAPSCLWTKCTASTRASRTPSCRMWKAACSPSLAPPPKTRRSRSTRPAVARGGVRAAASGRGRSGANRGPGQATGALPAMEKTAEDRLVAYADGDARRLLNTLETLAVAAAREKLAEVTDAWLLQACWASACAATTRAASSSTTPSARCTKVVRGSDPDAALYWLVRMLDGGADPRYMARRLVRMASEDIGLADPRALRLALDAAETYERLGSPEGELALAECVVYLAVAPKSNAVYKAFNEAGLCEKGRHPPGAPAPAQRAHAAHEGPGLRQALPLCARRSRRLCGRRALPARRHGRPGLLPAGGTGPGDPHCR
jgi:putative ATPase